MHVFRSWSFAILSFRKFSKSKAESTLLQRTEGARGAPEGLGTVDWGPHWLPEVSSGSLTHLTGACKLRPSVASVVGLPSWEPGSQDAHSGSPPLFRGPAPDPGLVSSLCYSHLHLGRIPSLPLISSVQDTGSGSLGNKTGNSAQIRGIRKPLLLFWVQT